MENGTPKVMMKQFAVLFLALILFAGAGYLWTTSKKDKTVPYPKLETPVVMGTERYKVVGPVLLPSETEDGKFEPGFQVHLDDGRMKYIAVPQAARDPELLNVSEGYLYRINGQFYLKKN